MKIAIFGLDIRPEHILTIDKIILIFNNNNIEYYIHSDFFNKIANECKLLKNGTKTFSLLSDLSNDIDLMISIGGDGTLLKSFQITKNKQLPVIGVNTGRLGFLSEISINQLEEAIKLLLEEKYTVEERMLLELNTGKGELFTDYNYALNEITVTKMDTSSMISIHTYVDNEFLSSYWADGLIISTPTGSTAYSLSVGGPILPPTAKNIVITPIAPHNLTMRPIVIPSTSKIELKIEGRGTQFLSSIDSRSEAIDFPGTLLIKEADFKAKTIKLDGNNFFNTLRKKLMWGTDYRRQNE